MVVENGGGRCCGGGESMGEKREKEILRERKIRGK